MAEFWYGNDGTNYRVLDHTEDISLELCNMIANEVCIGFLSDYRGERERQPSAVTVMLTDMRGILSEKRLILCRQARMLQAASPSFLAHVCILEEFGCFAMDFFKRLPEIQLDNIFRKDIYDIGKTSFAGKCSHFLLKPEAQRSASGFDRKAVLESLLDGCMKSSRYQMRLVLDRTGSEYDMRSREVISELYGALPEGLRRELGFCTFAQPNCRIPREIRLILLDPALMGIEGESNAEEFYYLGKAMPHRYIEPEIEDYVDSLLSGHYVPYHKGRQCSVREAVAEHNLSVRWKIRPVSEIYNELVYFARSHERNRKTLDWARFRKVLLERKKEIWNVLEWECVLGPEAFDYEKFEEWYMELELLSYLYDVIPEFGFPEKKVRCVIRKLMLFLDETAEKGDAAGKNDTAKWAGELLRLLESSEGKTMQESFLELRLSVAWFVRYSSLLNKIADMALESADFSGQKEEIIYGSGESENAMEDGTYRASRFNSIVKNIEKKISGWKRPRGKELIK